MADVKFAVGEVYTTANVASKISKSEIIAALARYMQGDWGDTCEEDKASNDEALQDAYSGFMAVYHDSNDVKFWIITDYGRGRTTVLLPEDY